jgi:hypothetical protein
MKKQEQGVRFNKTGAVIEQYRICFINVLTAIALQPLECFERSLFSNNWPFSEVRSVPLKWSRISPPSSVESDKSDNCAGSKSPSSFKAFFQDFFFVSLGVSPSFNVFGFLGRSSANFTMVLAFCDVCCYCFVVNCLLQKESGSPVDSGEKSETD